MFKQWRKADEAEMNASELNRETGENVEGPGRSAMVVMLDRAIVVLMVAILLSLSWPVCQVMWQQLRPRPARPVTIQSAPMLETGTAEALHRDVAEAAQRDVI